MSFAPKSFRILFDKDKGAYLLPLHKDFLILQAAFDRVRHNAGAAVCNEIGAIPPIIRNTFRIFNQNTKTKGGGTDMEFKLFMLARVLRVANLWRQGMNVDKIARGLVGPSVVPSPRAISPPEVQHIDYIKR